MIEIELGTYLINLGWLSLVLGWLLVAALMVIAGQHIVIKRRGRGLVAMQQRVTDARLEAGWHFVRPMSGPAVLVPPSSSLVSDPLDHGPS